MNARTQDVVLATDSLTQKQEDFARYYVECRNQTTAYRMAYDCDPHKDRGAWIHREASRTMCMPRVSARIAELRSEAEAHTLIKARDVLQDWVDMSSTDSNELVRVATYNCRHCHGDGNRYQWVDETELVEAVEAKQLDIDRGIKHVRLPEARGGFGFKVRRPPNPDCVKCWGRGETVVHFTDSDKLSAKARKLYKGAKVTKDGIEMLMHDANDSRGKLAAVLIPHAKDLTLNPAAASQPTTDAPTEAAAATSYLEMIGLA